jgi:competence protein ComEC
MNPQIAKPAFYFALALSLALSRQSAGQSAPVPEFCPTPDTAGLLIRFFDVGQGDATLLTTSEGRHVLVDGGPHPTRALGYLSALGVDTIALLIASHHHLDHIGGLPAILDSLTVTNVVENGLPATTRIYANLVSALERSGARVLRAEARELGIGSLQIRIIPPWTRFRSQNLASVGAVATFGAFRILFTGDAEGRALQSWTAQGMIPRVTVVRVGHHGSLNGTTMGLVQATRPGLAIVSVGARNSYGHPSPRIIAAWTSAQATVLRTDEHGTIVVRGCSDGSYSVLSSSPSVPRRQE